MLLPGSWLGLWSCCHTANADWDIPPGLLSCMAGKWIIASSKAFSDPIPQFSLSKGLQQDAQTMCCHDGGWAFMSLRPTWLPPPHFRVQRRFLCKTIWNKAGWVPPRLLFEKHVEGNKCKCFQSYYSHPHIEQYRKANYTWCKWLGYYTVLTIFTCDVDSL